MEFVQFDLLTNMSDPFPKKIVRERLTQSSALYGERLRDIVYYVVVNTAIGGRLLGFPLTYLFPSAAFRL